MPRLSSAMLCPRKTTPRSAFALLRAAARSRRNACQCFTTPSQFIAMPRFASDKLSGAMPSPCPESRRFALAVHVVALPFLCGDMLSIAFAMRFNAKPARIRALHCLCVALHRTELGGVALPLRGYSIHCVSIALPDETMPCRCCVLVCHSMPVHATALRNCALPLRLVAMLCFSIASPNYRIRKCLSQIRDVDVPIANPLSPLYSLLRWIGDHFPNLSIGDVPLLPTGL